MTSFIKTQNTTIWIIGKRVGSTFNGTARYAFSGCLAEQRQLQPMMPRRDLPVLSTIDDRNARAMWFAAFSLQCP